jgi:hypothetical protein
MNWPKDEAQRVLDAAVEEIRTAGNPFIGTPNTKISRGNIESVLEKIVKSVAKRLGAVCTPDIKVSQGTKLQDIRIRFLWEEDEPELEGP